MAQEQSVVPEDASAGGARSQASVALEQRVMGAGTTAETEHAIAQKQASVAREQRVVAAGALAGMAQVLQMLQEVPLEEERLNIVEQKLGEPGVDPGEHERQQRIEERQAIVEQQWRNRHARELEEQSRLLQALRDEQERLRHEQEKIRNNEKSRERRAGKAAQRARARVGSELRKIRRYVGDAQWQHPRACLAVPRHV
jgi:hypothetical protein